ncbi:MAG: hypothetical protein GXY82_04535 [Methanospirillum sp.]|nr:hypothetical protein [Methanospirillum sp.]
MKRLPVALLALLLLATTGTAASVEIQPDRILDGETVTIEIGRLADGVVFSLLLEGSVETSPSGTFAFRTVDLSMPFSLEQGQVTASLEQTETNELVVQRGDALVTMSGGSTEGAFEVEREISIGAGTYDEISLTGTAAPGATEVRTSLALTGIKRGPADSTISFRVRGVTRGSMKITILENAEQVFSKNIALGPPPTPTPAPTQAAGTVVPVLSAVVWILAGFRRR